MAIKYKDMAIEYKKLKDEVEKAPLSQEEFQIIESAEKYIDSEIKKQFKGYEVFIDLTIASFSYNMSTKKQIELPNARKKLMQKELEQRYKKAGWKIRIEFDDGLDGPNMSGPDNWILSGKGR